MADISIRRLRKSYGRNEVVHGVDLEIRDGEFIVILGPSGCGKSTLLRMIAGLEEVTSGEIAIGGAVVNRLEPRERGCAMVFQNYALYPHMSVAENIGYALKVAGVAKAERAEKVREVARILGLEDLLERRPGQLSGGQRQRVAMGRAIVREPKVFLFDEPLSNLDARLRVQMRLEIRRLHQRLKATSVFVTHDQVEAMTLADKLVVMNGGNIEQVGSPGEVYRRPASRFVGSFIGSPPMNFIPGTVDGDGRHVVFADGTRLAFDPARYPATGGQGVDLGIRPEHMKRLTAPEDGAPVLVAEFIEELGAGRLLHGHVGDMPVVVALDPEDGVEAGDRITLSGPSAHVHLFDPGSGRRLDAAPAEREAAA